MDGEMPASQNIMQPETQENKRGVFKSLALLKVGIIEFLLVGIVLVLLFGILNYFNILRLSSLFPSQLSWLPHKQNQEGNKTKAIPNVNYTPSVFQYDTEKGKKIFTAYIKEALSPKILPSNYEATKTPTNNELDIRFKSTNGANIYALFHFNENSNTLRDFSIFIEPQNMKGKTVTSALANSLLSSYFLNPFTISSCATKKTTSYCEQFQEEKDGKRGFAIISSKYGTVSTFFVATCFIPKESQKYTERTSCLRISE